MKLLFLVSFLIILKTDLLSAKIFNAKSFSLDNGLKVIVIENKRAPVVTQMLWYNVGSIDEEYGKSGLAHFMEHLMFKGTKKFPGSFYSNFISKNGGSENAFTSYDYTAYYQIIPSEKIEKIIELEADRMKNLTLTKMQFETEKRVILEERYQRVDSDPSSVLDEAMRKSLFPNHKYGTPIIGWEHEIKGLKFDDIKKFYEKYYNPSNAILVFSGDVDFKELEILVKKYFDNIKNSEKNIERVFLNDPPMKTSIQINHSHPGVRQKIWKRFFRAPSYKESIKKGIALDLGIRILAGGSTSILYNELVEKQKMVSAIGGYYQGMTRENGSMYFYAIPNDGVSINEIEKVIDDKIKDAIEKKMTEEKFQTQKKKYYYDSIYLRDSILQPAQILGESLTIGLSLEEIENWNKYLNEIELKDVINELKNFYNNKTFVSGILG